MMMITLIHFCLSSRMLVALCWLFFFCYYFFSRALAYTHAPLNYICSNAICCNSEIRTARCNIAPRGKKNTTNWEETTRAESGKEARFECRCWSVASSRDTVPLRPCRPAIIGKVLRIRGAGWHICCARLFGCSGSHGGFSRTTLSVECDRDHGLSAAGRCRCLCGWESAQLGIGTAVTPDPSIDRWMMRIICCNLQRT